MVQHTIDSKTNKCELGATKTEPSIHDRQLPVPVKKIVLRDVQNDNKISAPSSAVSSSPSKDKMPNTVPRISGTKRPLSECHNPPEQKPTSSSSGHGPLVYVRRKSEADAVRSSTNDNASIIVDGHVSKKLRSQGARTGPILQKKELSVQGSNNTKIINADGQVTKKLSNHEVKSGPIPETREPAVLSATDTENMSVDDQVPMECNSNQDASTGPVSQTKEPTVQSANDDGKMNVDPEPSTIICMEEAGTGQKSQLKEPVVYSANDNATINVDSKVSRRINNQEEGGGPITQTKDSEVHCVRINASTNTDYQVSGKLSNQEASTGLISHRKEPEVHSITNDSASITADSEASSIVGHQEADSGPVSQTKESKLTCANDDARTEADGELPRIVSPQEAGTVPISQPKEPKVHFANANVSVKADCPLLRVNSHQDASTRPVSQLKEPIYGIPVFAPFPRETAAILPGKPSVPLLQSKPSGPAGSNGQPLASTTPSSGSSKVIKNLHWEERFHQLKLLLKRLDQSDHEGYPKMLRSLSSVELSRHAVELEKRSIQLLLEEAKELKRVANLNVLGKPVKPFKVPSTLEDKSEK